MSLNQETVRTVYAAQEAYRLGQLRLRDWNDVSSGGVHYWAFLRRLQPSNENMFSWVIELLYPELKDKWVNSGFRSAVVDARGAEFRAGPTTRFVESWVRRPDIWDNTHADGKYVVLNHLSASNTPLSESETWTLIMRTIATADEPFPQDAFVTTGLLKGSARLNLSYVTSCSISPKDLEQASLATNYSPFLIDVLLNMPFDAVETHEFQKHFASISEALIWSAVVMHQAEMGHLEGTHNSALRLVDEFRAKEIEPVRYLEVAEKTKDPTLTYYITKEGIDESLWDSLTE